MSLPYSSKEEKKKTKIIVEIQRKAIKIFSNEIARMWYTRVRLEKHKIENLKKLIEWMDIEIESGEQRI